MMSFRTIKDAIEALLVSGSAGQFKVVGYQRQAESSVEVKDTNRLLQVFAETLAFPQDGSTFNGPVKAKPRYRLFFTVSMPAKVDLATLNDDNATAVQKQTALANLAEAAKLADDSMDEFWELAYQILMDARQQDLGLGGKVVASRWITEITKDEPIERGDLVVLTASAFYHCNTEEQLTGDNTGTELTDGIHTQIENNDENGVPDPNVNVIVTT